MATRLLLSFILATLLATVVCGLSPGEKETLKGKVNEAYKSVAFQRDFSRLTVKTEVETLEKKMLGKTRKSNEADCVRKAGKSGLIEGLALVDVTLGAIMPKLDEAKKAVESPGSPESSWSAAAHLITSTDIDAYIEKATDEFDDRFPSVVANKQQEMQSCLV